MAKPWMAAWQVSELGTRGVGQVSRQCSGAGGAQIAQGGSSGWQRHCSTGGDWDQDLRVAQDPGEMKGSGDLGRALNHLNKQECNFCNRKVK